LKTVENGSAASVEDKASENRKMAKKILRMSGEYLAYSQASNVPGKNRPSGAACL